MDADEKWIASLDGVLTETDMRAAIARGREQGRAEVMPEVERLRREAADDYQNVMAPLVDMLGKAVQATHFAWSGHALDAARVLIADRDRLAKRCEELEATTLALFAARAPDQKRISELSQRCAELDEVVKVLRREGQLPRDIGELNRLAALEQRVGALVEALRDTVHVHDGLGEPLRTRLAALRSPDDPEMARQNRALMAQVAEWRAKYEAEVKNRVSLQRACDLQAGTMESVKRDRDALTAERDRLRVCLTNAKEAFNGGACTDDGLAEELGAYIQGLIADRLRLNKSVGEQFRDKERALDELSQARIEVETIQSKLAGAEHAIADLTTTFGTVESERNALRARIAELEAREKGARWLLATAHITKSLTPPEWHSKREAWLAGGHAAPIPDPARGLIERAAKVLETYVPLSEDELIADLRAYLGGGT